MNIFLICIFALVTVAHSYIYYYPTYGYSNGYNGYYNNYGGWNNYRNSPFSSNAGLYNPYDIGSGITVENADNSVPSYYNPYNNGK